MATPTHDLCLKTGEYSDRQTGEQKANWLKVGTVFKHDDGGTSIKLDCLPVGMPEWKGWLNVFPRKDRQGQQAPASRPAPPRGGQGSYGPPPSQSHGHFEDDIPF